jgi:hypothetical protein
VAAVIVKGSIGSLKVAVRFRPRGPSTLPPKGAVEVTFGGVVSGTAPVVKDHTRLLAIAFPARSRAPVVIVAVYAVLGASAFKG